MRVYLVRHGEALSDREDSQRPLSPMGRAQVEESAKRAKAAGAHPLAIHHSGKLRAQQTAEIMGAHLGASCSELAGLAPEDDPGVAARFIAAAEGDLMLVGHLPHVARLASLLTNDSREIPFHTAAVVCLERDTPGAGWRVIAR